MSKVLFLLLWVPMVAGCVTTAINSDPQGAKVYVNGEYQGDTPIGVGLSDWSSTSLIRVEKDGYHPQEKVVVKQTTTSYQTQTGSAFASGYNPNAGTTTVYGSGVGTSTTVKSKWPTEVFFKLELIEGERKW